MVGEMGDQRSCTLQTRDTETANESAYMHAHARAHAHTHTHTHKLELQKAGPYKAGMLP
jgi:hypothetical protein